MRKPKCTPKSVRNFIGKSALITSTLVLLVVFSTQANQLIKRNDMPVLPQVNFDIHINGISALSKFEGQVKGCQILLSWGTNHEIGNDYFEIERSINGDRFFPIGSVKGAGNSISPQKYQYADEEIVKANYFYRLKLVDFNGDHFFSDIIQVETACQREGLSIDNITKNPNASNWINVQLYTEYDLEGATILIKDKAERSVKKVTAEIKPGMNIVPLDSKGLKKGTYEIQIITEDAPSISLMYTKDE